MRLEGGRKVRPRCSAFYPTAQRSSLVQAPWWIAKAFNAVIPQSRETTIRSDDQVRKWKLTETVVSEIREAFLTRRVRGEKVWQIAARFGIDRKQVRRIGLGIQRELFKRLAPIRNSSTTSSPTESTSSGELHVFLMVRKPSRDTHVRLVRTAEDIRNELRGALDKNPQVSALIHVGFRYPASEQIDALLDRFVGRALISEAARWIFHGEFVLLDTPVAVWRDPQREDMPIYLIIEGLDCVMNGNVEMHVGARQREHQNRTCWGEAPIYARSLKPSGDSDWIRHIQKLYPSLYSIIKAMAIGSDKEYLNVRHELSPANRAAIDVLRFEWLASRADRTEPFLLVHFVPARVLELPVSELTPSVRLHNVLMRENVSYVCDLLVFDREIAFSWRNYGRTCHLELASALVRASLDTRHIRYVLREPDLPSSKDTCRDLLALSTSALSTLRSDLEHEIAQLPIKHGQIIAMRLGLYGPPETLSRAGTNIGLTGERTRQIEKASWQKLAKSSIGFLLECRVAVSLVGRLEPLYLDQLRADNLWFAGFEGKPHALAYIIEKLTGGRYECKQTGGGIVVSFGNVDAR